MLKKIYSFIKDCMRFFYSIIMVIRYAIIKDKIDGSICYLRSESEIVKKGEEDIYEIKIYNNKKQSEWFYILIDIYQHENSVHPEGHQAFYYKKIFFKKEEYKRIYFHYNWLNNGFFNIDDLKLVPDNEWNNTCSYEGLYSIKAVLKNNSEKIIEEIYIIQKMII